MRRLLAVALGAVSSLGCASFRGDASASGDSGPPEGGDGSPAATAGDAGGAGLDGPTGDAPTVAGDAAGSEGGDASPALYATKCSSLGAAACSCSAPDPSTPGNDFACNDTVVPSSVCCADPSWPSAGSTCSCMTASCTFESGGGCDCSLGASGQSCNDGTVCCVGPNHDCLCTYGVSTCWQGYRTVAQCDAPSIGCGSGMSRVTTCNVGK